LLCYYGLQLSVLFVKMSMAEEVQASGAEQYQASVADGG
jgi:hypothetical protein